MKFFAVAAKTYFSEESGLSSYHYDLFHGRATRYGTFLRYSPRDITQTTKRFRLLINLYKAPAIIEPRTRLIVQPHVRQRFATLANVKSRECVVERVCNVPFQRWAKVELNQDSDSSEAAIVKCSQPLKTRVGVPCYFELAVPEIEHLVGSKMKLRTHKIYFPANDEESSIRISAEILQSYPLTWHDGYHVLSEALFDKCEVYFDWDYFEYICQEL
jgi:hypothetical protein